MNTDYMNCYDLVFKEMGNDLEQLHAYVVNAQIFIRSWQSEKYTDASSWFDIANQMFEPLTRFSQLTTSLYEIDRSELNDDQLKMLVMWERTIALAFCFIQWFIQIDDESNEKENLTDQFCIYASSELRTPFTLLKGYSQMFQTVSENQSKTEQAEQLVKHVLSSPFVPKHEDTLLQIDHWIEQIWNFIDYLTTQTVKGRKDES